MEKEVASQCEKALGVFSEMGCRLVADQPEVRDAFEAFQTLRAFLFMDLAADYKHHKDQMKDTVAWNINKGLHLSGIEIVRAEAARTEFYHRVRVFLDKYEFLLLPSTQVTPFPVEEAWVKEIDGIDMKTYIDWMAMNCVVTLTGLPAISVPCGFTETGLPVGLQIVGRLHRDFDVLQLAYAFEQATQFHLIRPNIDRP